MSAVDRKLTSVIVVPFVLLLFGACSRAKAPENESESEMMKAGLDALYGRDRPNEAIVQFSRVLKVNPNHYGATFQLAKALDLAGKRDDARGLWDKMLKMAEAANDLETAATVRARLRELGSTSGETDLTAEMNVGLDLLYAKTDPIAAAARFRKVLARDPNHYGATFQLAVALDRGGKTAEARSIWEKMLKMAEAANDSETLATVRSRLAQRP